MMWRLLILHVESTNGDGDEDQMDYDFNLKDLLD